MKRLLAFGLSLGLIATAGSAAGREPPRVAMMPGDGELSYRQQQKALKYWTPQRMRDARPMPLPTAERRRPKAGIARASDAPMGIAQGSRPSRAGLANVTLSDEVYPYPYPYTRYALDASLYGRHPYRTIGRIFGRTASGTAFWCSGASIASSRRHLVWTAGHCVSAANGVWHRSLVFVPAYKEGKRPFGAFPLRSLVIPAEWHESGDWRFDYAAGAVGKGTKGRKLREAVGALGFIWDYPRDLHWNAFGYPAARPFNGKFLHVCQASRATDDLTELAPEPMGIGCDQTTGASGGPWIYRLRRGDFLGSVHSYRFVGQPEAMFGPYLTSRANRIRCLAATGGRSDDC